MVQRMRLRTSSLLLHHMIYIMCKGNYKLYIWGYSPFSYLKTKESYDMWITRRVWGFIHQISKAKYLNMSVENIGKLQENTAALCKMAPGKLKCRPRMLSGWAEMSAADVLWVSAIKGSGYVWPRKLKRLLSHPASGAGCEIFGEGGVSAGQRYPRVEWAMPRVVGGTVCVYKV